MVLKDADSPNKLDPSIRNSRRPDFFKNINKNGSTQQPAPQRKSFKDMTILSREQPHNEFKNRDSPSKMKITKNKELR